MELTDEHCQLTSLPMHDQVLGRQPSVSILLPTYNRAHFLEQAFAAIRAQTWTDWELIVVDDGSTDETEAIVGNVCDVVAQPVRYVKQSNAGPYAARNTALDLATGAYVAFYDSDDLWLPFHLERCVVALERNPDVDWVYAACRTVDYPTGQILTPDTFTLNGGPRPFCKLATDIRGDLHVLGDEAVVECALLDGLFCGLQNSVLRRAIFDEMRFEAANRNEAEDQLFVIRTLKRGHRIGYLKDVHVQYHVHDANSSGSARGELSVERLARLLGPVSRGFEDLRRQVTLTPNEERALRKRLNREYFWHLGYGVYWRNGHRKEALDSFRRGLQEWPWSLRCWKTYLGAGIRAPFAKAAR